MISTGVGEVTSPAHSPLEMKRHHHFHTSYGSTSVKKLKLEPVEALDEDYRVDHTIRSLAHNVENGDSECSRFMLSNKQGDQEAELPPDFLEPLSPERILPTNSIPFTCIPTSLIQSSCPPEDKVTRRSAGQVTRQFWKAGDYEGESAGWKPVAGGIDHVRVHPKFLHSNATSHKWALGAMAELLDNALDEAERGATFVNVDTIRKPGDGNPMLLIEDDGGGMNPERMRHCMSLGYSAKSKMANTIGQYGNGFKTSTMRLGADVIVFSCSPEREGCIPTQSIGMLSYTFLRDTGQEDIIVPMVDYEIQTSGVQKLIRSNVDDWNRNMETLKRWSPYSTESKLLDQFNGMKHQGTRIIVYNLWEDDEGRLELDFDTDPYDIQARGANRDEKNISMAERLPNSRHFLTYRHSLRSYASILYLRLPKGFKMSLRGKEIKHHSLVNDLMITQKVTYRPQGGLEQEQEHEHEQETSQLKAVVTIGFVKDAKEHADVQGFNVYHKNRLIKPFWRLWNSASSQGRGIIGVLEANFVEPAHDKQGFERTTVLSRLEARLLKMQKAYWIKHCHKVGYYNHHLKKQKKIAASAVKSVSVDELKPWKSLPSHLQTKRQKVLHALPGQSQAIPQCGVLGPPFPWVVPRSLRSQRRCIPARAYCNATGSLTCTRLSVASSPISGPQQRDPVFKIKSLEDLGHTPLKRPLRTERIQSPPDQVATAAQVIPSEKNGNSTQDNMADPEVQSQAFQIENRRTKQLELQLVDMEQQLKVMQRNLEKVKKERDLVREELEEERKQGELNDEELRKKLKETLLRVRELEAENNRLRSAQH